MLKYGKVMDTSLVNKHNLFVLEVLKAWINPKQKSLKTMHHKGYGKFVVDGETITLKSKMNNTCLPKDTNACSRKRHTRRPVYRKPYLR